MAHCHLPCQWRRIAHHELTSFKLWHCNPHTQFVSIHITHTHTYAMYTTASGTPRSPWNCDVAFHSISLWQNEWIFAAGNAIPAARTASEEASYESEVCMRVRVCGCGCGRFVLHEKMACMITRIRACVSVCAYSCICMFVSMYVYFVSHDKNSSIYILHAAESWKNIRTDKSKLCNDKS